MTTATETTSIHPFEAAGLGKAPFRYVGTAVQEIGVDGRRVLGHVGGATVTTKPGGTCAYCGTYIVNMFDIESADGNRFHVGCECVKKTGDAVLVKKVDAAVREMNRKRRADKKRQKETADRELCESANLNVLADRPHPHPYRASLGETLADWARFCVRAKAYGTLATVLRREAAGEKN